MTKTTKKITLPTKHNVDSESTNKNNNGISQTVLLTDIDVSPFNYRQKFNPQTLNELADDLARNGMISSIIVRPMPGDRYEQVTGGRRYKAAHIAQLEIIPVIVRALTDQQVRQIQLAENMQRENPHPLDEARGIYMLQEDGKSIDDIAARIGKSKAFVYSRIKLSQLIDPIQQVYISDKINTQDALEIAALSAESQQDFFNSYCKEWEKDSFQLWNAKNCVSRYKYDLKQAPFDIMDKKLVADAGACGKCPFNSATLKSLFPELSKEAKCTNAGCFKNKCLAHTEAKIRSILQTVKPAALIFFSSISETEQMLIGSLPELVDLPQYSQYNVSIHNAPIAPDKDDFIEYRDDDDDNEQEDFDEEGYQLALEEYKIDQEEYIKSLTANDTPKALLFGNSDIRVVAYEIKSNNKEEDIPKVTAKAVQEAIKSGTATVNLLQAEITRIKHREARAKEIDQDKIQLSVHEQFSAMLTQGAENMLLTAADQAAIRLIVYQSLTWEARKWIDNALFPESGKRKYYSGISVEDYGVLSEISDQQFSLLIRAAVACKSDSKQPGNITAHCLYQVAKDSGLDVENIEQLQKSKAAERQEKMESRINDLDKKITKLQLKKAA